MTIKNYISAILFLLAETSLSAQKDTTYQTIRQETGEYTAPVIETPADRLFRTKVPARLMFKMNPAKFFINNENDFIPGQSTDGYPLEIGSEYKLSPAFSIGAYAGINFGIQQLGSSNEERWLNFSTLSLEGRWYHDMKKRIQEGRSANNFGGKYLALEGILLNYPGRADSWDNSRISLRYGMQQRFMRNGYFDISIGLGLSSNRIKRQIGLSTDQRVSVGLAAFLPQSKPVTPNGGLCDVLHCQDEQYKMLKINFLNTVRIQSVGDYFSLGLIPGIAYEHKIGRSPFSVEVDLKAGYNFNKFVYYTFPDQRYNAISFTSARWNASSELRWYYSMRKRILKGHSGNNLSGTFIGLQINRSNLIKSAVTLNLEEENSFFDNITVGSDYWTNNLIWGIQQRLFDRGFIQFKIGAGSTFGGHNYRYEGPDQPLSKVRRDNELNILTEMKVGLAF